jgi:hypothetical protein
VIGIQLENFQMIANVMTLSSFRITIAKVGIATMTGGALHHATSKALAIMIMDVIVSTILNVNPEPARITSV